MSVIVVKAVLIFVVAGAEEIFVFVDAVAADVAEAIVEETKAVEDDVLSLVVGPESGCVVLVFEGTPVVVGSNLELVVVKTEFMAAGSVDLGSLVGVEAIVVFVWANEVELFIMVT